MPLITYLLLWSIFLQVVLTFLVLFRMRFARVKAFKEGTVTAADIAVKPESWPEDVRKVQNNYINQFELPVLFYMACAIVLAFSIESWLFVLLAWVFVLSRYVHTYIHLGSNKIKYRFRAFLVGLACVGLQWLHIMFLMTMAWLASY